MLTLYAHPFSSYSWKALIAFYENATPFTYKIIGPDDPDAVADWSRRWPIRKFPVLLDGDETIVEASIIESSTLTSAATPKTRRIALRSAAT